MGYEIQYSELFKTMPFDDAVDYSIKLATNKINEELDEHYKCKWYFKMLMKYGILPISLQNPFLHPRELSTV